MDKKYVPIEVSDVDKAFGGKAMEILPRYEDIPAEFKRNEGIWQKWQNEWFFNRLKHYPIAKEGIDLHKAMGNLACVQRSFAPKHEHKQAGIAYLASLWFSSPSGAAIKK